MWIFLTSQHVIQFCKLQIIYDIIIIIIIQMATIAQKIQNIAGNVDTGNMIDLKQGLKQMASFTKNQLLANQSTINYPVQQLAQAIQRNLKVNQQQITPNVKNLIRNVADILPNKLKKQVGSTMIDLERQVTKKNQQNRIEKMVSRQTQKIQDQIMKQAIKQKDITNISTLKPISSANVSLNKSPIQQSVQMFAPILNNVNLPTVVKPSQIPQTMKLLTRYANIMGASSVGTVTNQSGVSYVGTRTIDRGNGVTQILPFEKNVINKTNIPSIPMQLQYFANRTINSWNKYIDSESKFVNFLSKVNTQSDRKSYVQKQFDTLNMSTFCAQVIASLAHYYIYLPLQRMAGKMGMNSQITPTFLSFIQSYQIGNTPSTNPLLFSNAQGAKLADKMFTQGAALPQDFLTTLRSEYLDNQLTSKLNSGQLQKMKRYMQNRYQQAYNFMRVNGLDEKLIKSVLIDNHNWSSVKKKRFLITQGLQNTQLSQIAARIQQKSQKQEQKDYYIRYTWASPQICTHDYLWGWGQKYN